MLTAPSCPLGAPPRPFRPPAIKAGCPGGAPQASAGECCEKPKWTPWLLALGVTFLQPASQWCWYHLHLEEEEGISQQFSG